MMDRRRRQTWMVQEIGIDENKIVGAAMETRTVEALS